MNRLGQCLAVPLAACVLWPRWRWLLAVVALPLTLVQWSPAWAAITTNGRDLSTHESYYQPLLAFLAANGGPSQRVEVVPTRQHWEVAYVAPKVALARGWERQLDTADNPIFYAEGALEPGSYRAWLENNGVQYVALADAALDYAGVGEAALLNGNVPGVREAWRGGHWRVFEVAGSTGILSGPAAVVRIDGGQVVVNATGPGIILVRVHYTPRWSLVAGPGCLGPGDGGWMSIAATSAGQLRLQLQLTGDTRGSCPPS